MSASVESSAILVGDSPKQVLKKASIKETRQAIQDMLISNCRSISLHSPEVKRQWKSIELWVEIRTSMFRTNTSNSSWKLVIVALDVQHNLLTYVG